MKPQQSSRYIALCARPTEPLCAAELRALPGVTDIEIRPGAVAFSGGQEAMYRANLMLRTASRVLCLLDDFPVRGERDLYERVRAQPWERTLQVRGTLAVSAQGQSEVLRNSMFTAQRVKDAICDRFRDRTGARPDVDPERPDLRVNVQIYGPDDDPRCQLALDSSGEPLHRRGYRKDGGPAPMKESLAAAILRLAGYSGQTLCDLCCGSGTLVIEGGFMALSRAPGLYRRFGFQRWLDFDSPLWVRIVGEAQEQARLGEPKDRPPFLFGGDLDGQMVTASRRNADAARLGAYSRFAEQDLLTASPPPEGPPGIVVCNPPYGERMAEAEALVPLYRGLGDTLKRRFAGYTAYVFTANLPLGRQIGLRPKERHVLFNGNLEGRLLRFDLY